MSGSATSKKIVAGHSKADEKQEESHGITENESKAAFFDPSLVEMVSMTKSQFKPDLRRQPKVSGNLTLRKVLPLMFKTSLTFWECSF